MNIHSEESAMSPEALAESAELCRTLLTQAEQAIASGNFRLARQYLSRAARPKDGALEQKHRRIEQTLAIDPAQVFVVLASFAVFLWTLWRYWAHA